MVINKQFILVRIDKAKQVARREKMGSIYLAPKWNYMKRNLQYGEVIQIGQGAAKLYPDLEVGHTAIFKHIIEEEDWRLVGKDYNPAHPNDRFMMDEYRLVDTTSDLQLFGFINADGQIVANGNYVFCDVDIKLLATDIITSLLIESDASNWNDDEWADEQLRRLTIEKDNLTETIRGITDPYKFENMHSEMERVAKTMEKVTKFMHAPKLCWIKIKHINKVTSDWMKIQSGDIIITDKNILYPLELMGHNYYLVHYDCITALRN